jgi:hypothetical protein
MSYEDFLAAWKQAQGGAAADPRPRFLAEELRLSGFADERHARLKLELTVRLLTDAPVAVPLGLTGAILQDQPRFARAGAAAAAAENAENLEQEAAAESADGSRGEPLATAGQSAPATEFLEFSAQQGGLTAWFVGRADERRTLSLEMIVPLVPDGTETSLPLVLPRALLSRLSLEVRPAVTEASTTEGTIESQQPMAGGTQLVVVGLAGQCQISWRNAARSPSELTSVLSAAGTIQVAIDGRSIRTTARLTVRSHGGRFDRFRVRLPLGAKLLQNEETDGRPAAEYQLSIEEDTTRGEPLAAASGQQTVLVRLSERQTGPVNVELSTEQPLGPWDADLPVELAGFDVLGAVRQFGDVALRVAEDWQPRWEIGRYVRQVDPSELDPRLQQAGLTAAFQYDRQNWSLGIRVAARRLGLHVTPMYELDCLADEARLRVRLTCQVLGARAFDFRVHLNGWELTSDPIESGGLVDRERVQVTPEGVLILPLAQAATRRAEVSLVLRRATPRENGPLRLPLPTPAAESVGAGELTARPGPGIELVPDLTLCQGLTLAPVGEGPADALRALRFYCIPPEVVFAADRLRRTRDVTVSVSNLVRVGPLVTELEQRFDYTVKFEPLAEVAFIVPNAPPYDFAETKLSLLDESGPGNDGERASEAELPLRIVADSGERPADRPQEQESAASADDAGAPPQRTIRATLPQPRFGRFVIRFRAQWNQSVRPAVTVPLAVSLLQPAEGRLASHRAVVQTSREVNAALDEAATTSWRPGGESIVSAVDLAARAPVGARMSGEWLAPGPEAVLPLVVSGVDPAAPTATNVKRVWLQTWISSNERQDRAAFRFHSVGSQVTIELPPQTPPSEVEVLLDGEPADVVSRVSGRLTIRLDSQDPAAPPTVGQSPPDSSDRTTHVPPARTLELRYRQPATWPLVARWQLTPPQMVATSTFGEVYWQIVTPADRHVVRPPRLASASQWQWFGGFWGPRAALSQMELEQWAGATSGRRPTAGQNEYLFSGMTPITSIDIITAPRWLLVLAASGAVLALAVIWIYVPGIRRGWIAVGAACLLAAFGAAFPGPAMLAGQAAVLGIVLALLSLTIARLARRGSGPPDQSWPSGRSAMGGSSQRFLATSRTPTPVGPGNTESPLSLATLAAVSAGTPAQAREPES